MGEKEKVIYFYLYFSISLYLSIYINYIYKMDPNSWIILLLFRDKNIYLT